MNQTHLWIRFVGPGLDQRSVPIYDLAQVLIAIQRIHYKAYLYRENRLLKGEKLSDDERNLVALQLSDRKRGSDNYGLNAFFSDPYVKTIITAVLPIVLKSIGSFAYKSVFGNGDKEDDPKRKAEQSYLQLEKQEDDHLLESFIYRDVKTIVTRIGGVSGIRIIGIIPEGIDYPAFELDHSTKEYMKQIERKKFLGHIQEISGTLKSLHPATYIVEVKLATNKIIKVHLQSEDFETIRYQAKKDTLIEMTGRPIYRMGVETKEISEFKAYSIGLIGNLI